MFLFSGTKQDLTDTLVDPNVNIIYLQRLIVSSTTLLEWGFYYTLRENIYPKFYSVICQPSANLRDSKN